MLSSGMHFGGTSFVPLAAIGSLALLGGCHRPISDQSKLNAVATEALSLMGTHPARPPQRFAEVRKSDWPASIASLRPERVVVHEWGIDISVKAYFDGGWGYHVARNRSDLPMPDGCYSQVSRSVFWHGPC